MMRNRGNVKVVSMWEQLIELSKAQVMSGIGSKIKVNRRKTHLHSRAGTKLEKKWEEILNHFASWSSWEVWAVDKMDKAGPLTRNIRKAVLFFSLRSGGRNNSNTSLLSFWQYKTYLCSTYNLLRELIYIDRLVASSKNTPTHWWQSLKISISPVSAALPHSKYLSTDFYWIPLTSYP